jgi:hypothetical protein
MTQIKKKSLYFAIDGTILDASTKVVKKNLQNGVLELKIREAHFEKIFCVGNVNNIFTGLEQLGQHIEKAEIVYTLCFDAFTDFDWFVNTVCCSNDPDQGINQIDFTGDWWYMDDFAVRYLQKSGKDDILKKEKGKRIIVPDPIGNGQDIIKWFDSMLR